MQKQRKTPSRTGFYILILAALIIAFFESLLFGLIVMAAAIAYYTWRTRSSLRSSQAPEGKEADTTDVPQNP